MSTSEFIGVLGGIVGLIGGVTALLSTFYQRKQTRLMQEQIDQFRAGAWTLLMPNGRQSGGG